MEGNILLRDQRSIQYGTYGFHFRDSHQERVAGIYSTGWEKQTSTDYDWDGLTRGEIEVVVFQYTLKGEGEIRVDDHTYQLKEGDAFFVKIPSDHHYYLPVDSQEWEFVHITLFGPEALQYFEEITDDVGHILTLDIYATPITHIFDVLSKVNHNQLNDAYITSSLAYTFLMELQRFVLNIDRNDTLPDPIKKAVVYMNENYADQLSLDDIVDVSGLSKYHFTRLFHETVHSTPIQYLTKVRINKSIELLKNEALTIEHIAVQVGFSNGNYFNKVFRSALGMSPGKYRQNKLLISVDHLIM